MRRFLLLLPLMLGLLFAACIPPNETKSARDWPPKSPAEIEAMRCESGEPHILAAMKKAIDDASKGGGADAVSNAELVTTLRKEAPNARLVRGEAHTWMVEPLVPPAAELKRRMDALSFLQESAAKDNRKFYVDLLHAAFVQRLDELYETVTFSPEGSREGVRRGLACLRRSEAREASLLAVLASYQAGFRGEPSAIDTTLAITSASLEAPSAATKRKAEDEAAFWKLAQAKALEIDAESRQWLKRGSVRDERERLELIGILRPDAKLNVPSENVAITGEAPRDAAERAELVAAITGMLRGDLGSFLKGAKYLLPKESSLRVGLDGADAIRRGDVGDVIKAARALAPADAPVQKALEIAEAADKTVATAKGVSAPR